jgi:hypothetical protein
MAKRTVTAFYSSYEAAEGVATRLRTLGAERVNINQYEDDSYDDDINRYEGSYFGFMGNTYLGSYIPGFAAGIFPTGGYVSPMMRYTGAGGDILLEATVSDEIYEKALAIIDRSK